MNESVLIYRTYHIASQGGLQFYLSEIGRQLVKAPPAAAVSPYYTADRLAQLVEHRTAVREVAGSNLDRTNTQGLNITEEKVLPL